MTNIAAGDNTRRRRKNKCTRTTFYLFSFGIFANEITLMGSRYATKQEVLDSLDLVARGEVWPLVTEVVPVAEAEALHARLETGEVTARAAIRIG